MACSKSRIESNTFIRSPILDACQAWVGCEQVNWRQISISLIDTRKGEQKAQSCAITVILPSRPDSAHDGRMPGFTRLRHARKPLAITIAIVFAIIAGYVLSHLHAAVPCK